MSRRIRAQLRGSHRTSEPAKPSVGRGGGFRWVEMSCGDVIMYANPWPEGELTCGACGKPVWVVHRWTVKPPPRAVLDREEDFARFAAELLKRG